MRSRTALFCSLWIWGAALAGPALADTRPVAKLVSGDGVFLSTSTTPLKKGQRLGDGASLNLPDYGHAEILIYGDGHHEVLVGPCLVRVGPRGGLVIHGGSGCLARQVAARLVPVLPQNGELQSVGGSIAGISDPSMVKGQRRRRGQDSNTPERDTKDNASSTGGGGGEGTSEGKKRKPGTMMFRLPAGQPSSKVLAHRSEWNLLLMPQDTGQCAVRVEGSLPPDVRFTLQVRGKEQSVGVAGNDLKLPQLTPGTYRLAAYRQGQLEHVLPFRVLTAGERQRLVDLLAEEEPGKAALVIDGLDQLGFPSLAAQRAEVLLERLNYQDAGLLNYLQRLYVGVLRDKARAEALKARAASH